ncbi:MAG TPA: AAA family ATPase [Pirellulales bacterium]|nr:AAA family ATPase [Pirellulales bacterium]
MKNVTFHSVTIDRFRGFRHLELDGLERFNLILGRNNVGKTALLESLFLLLGPTNPQLTIAVSAFRGIDQFRSDPEDLWGWLFYEKNMDQEISLHCETDTGRRSLRITLTAPKEVNVKRGTKAAARKAPRVTQATTNIGPSELQFHYQDEKRQNTLSRAYIKETGIALEHGRQIKFPTSIFVTARGGYAAENAERFSKLEEVGRELEIVEPLRVIEPRLKRLAVIVTGAGPIIHGDIDLGRMIPLPLMGEGIGRLMTLLLAVAESKDGVVLIDEIETGLHYSAMPAAWTAIAQAARASNVQVFATTHSFECMRAAYESFADADPYDLAVQRIDRSDGEVTATVYDKDMLETALTSGIEVR